MDSNKTIRKMCGIKLKQQTPNEARHIIQSYIFTQLNKFLPDFFYGIEEEE